MNRLSVLILTLALTAVLAGRWVTAEDPDPAQRVPQTGTDENPPSTTRFETVDVFIDSSDQPLAAYQFEFRAASGDVTVVGIEGGDHAAFKTPPYYDPEALSKGRIILAAFNTGTDLPTGRNRVAILHVQIRDAAEPVYDATMTVSATLEGKPIPAIVSLARGAK